MKRIAKPATVVEPVKQLVAEIESEIKAAVAAGELPATTYVVTRLDFPKHQKIEIRFDALNGCRKVRNRIWSFACDVEIKLKLKFSQRFTNISSELGDVRLSIKHWLKGKKYVTFKKIEEEESEREFFESLDGGVRPRFCE